MIVRTIALNVAEIAAFDAVAARAWLHAMPDPDCYAEPPLPEQASNMQALGLDGWEGFADHAFAERAVRLFNVAAQAGLFGPWTSIGYPMGHADTAGCMIIVETLVAGPEGPGVPIIITAAEEEMTTFKDGTGETAALAVLEAMAFLLSELRAQWLRTVAHLTKAGG